jgi:hypothetical protein
MLLSAPANRLVNDLDDFAGSWINQNGTFVHDGVAVGISKPHARWDGRNSCPRWKWLTHSYGLGKLDRGTSSSSHVGAHASRLLGAESPANRRTCNAPDRRSDRTTHESANNSTTCNPRREASSCVGLASSQWKSKKGKSEGGNWGASTHGSSLQEAKGQRGKAWPVPF